MRWRAALGAPGREAPDRATTGAATSAEARAAVRGGAASSATAAIIVGSAVAGLAAYGFQILGTRALGDVGYAPVGVLWTVQFLLFSIFLHPVETWIAREVARWGRLPDRRALAAAAGWVLATLLVLSAAAGLARDLLFPSAPEVAVAIPLVGCAYLVYSVARGWLAGSGRYRSYAAVTATESVLRLLVAVGVALVAGVSALGLALVLPVGAAVAAVVALPLATRARSRPESAGPAGPIDDGSAGRFLLPVASANIAAQLLLAGGPILLAAVGADPASVAVSFVLLTVARAPLVFGYGGVLSRVLPPLVAMASAGDDAGLRRSAVRVLAGAAAVACVGGAAAAALAAPATGVVFGADFVAPRSFAGLAVAGCLLAAGNLLLNQVLIARRLESRVVPPWWAALLLAVAVVLLLPGDPLILTGVGLALGQVVAGGGLMIALLLPAARRSAPPRLAPQP